MENLAQIEEVRQKIRVASTTAIKALLKFSGFTFADNLVKYADMVEFARRLTISNLISCCNILGLKYDGSKEDIISRVCAGLINLNSLVTQDVEEEDAIEEGKEDERSEYFEGEVGVVEARPEVRTVHINGNSQVRFSMTYKDIADFENTATLFGWTKIQKMIFAKKSLSGPAKMLIESEGVMRTWLQFKTVLIKEFADKINSAELQEMLYKRKFYKDETMVSRGKIESEPLNQHVIEGIPDDTNNKLILYGIKTMEDFKETERNKEGAFKKKKAIRKLLTFKKTKEKEQESAIRCYNLSEIGHIALQCNAAEEVKAEKKQTTVNTVCVAFNNKRLKEIMIKDTCLKALIDSGSQVTVMREDVYKNLKLDLLFDTTICLSGFGKKEVWSLGCFQTVVKIDNENFPCTIDVVPSDEMNKTEVVMNVDGITIRKMSPTMFLVQINVLEEKSLNIDTSNTKLREKVETLVKIYKPNMCKTTGVTMRIVFKDDKPIFEKLRRLPASEKEVVKNQVEE
ncbi:hypothetical protein PUN28_012872 [Cardiocondyla obscurior]|uniref:Aspartic peptidase DDI1-type domain-containing protein n=1 Tax=Cardiocondyla obscurior TaxID=286306 RepID=A0AAW2F5T3_9HYME